LVVIPVALAQIARYEPGRHPAEDQPNQAALELLAGVAAGERRFQRLDALLRRQPAVRGRGRVLSLRRHEADRRYLAALVWLLDAGVRRAALVAWQRETRV